MENLAVRLARVPHFRSLPASALSTIVAAGRMGQFSGGSTIFLEGDPCAGMFVLLTGRVHLCKLGPQGHEQIVGVIDPVIMFNEVAVLDGGPNPVTAVAVRDCVVWRIGHEDLQDLIQRYPVVGTGLLRVLAARNRALLSRCEDLSYRSVPARLAKLLLELSRRGALPVERRDHPIRELAAHIGTVPELVSRSLRSLQDDGLVSSTRSQIGVVNVAGLAAVAGLEEAPQEARTSAA
jgi:CRP/FNR family transcriptional regulator